MKNIPYEIIFIYDFSTDDCSRIIKEITNKRIEMLGYNFTFQHSDSRVLEQLVYKWEHSKKIIGKILI